jgi:hypothetical protein
MKKIIQLNGPLKLKLKLTVLMMLLCKDPPQLFQTTIIESMPGLTHNMKKLTLPNGKPRLLKLLKVDTMLLPRKDRVSPKPQLFQTTTTESTLGLMHNMKKITHLNGLLKLKLKLTVLMMLLLKENTEEDTEFQEILSFPWKHQQPQIITT